MKKLFGLLAVCGLMVTGANAQVFTEDFGALTDGTAITTSNTDFTYVRTSTGGGAQDPDAVSPGNFSTGSSMFMESPSGSLTGVGVEDDLTSSNVYTLSVDFRLTGSSNGDIVFGVGSGGAFTGNSTFSTSDGLFWLQSDSGNFERRTGSGWSNIGSSGTSLSDATNYSLHVVANGSGGNLSYTGGSVAAGTMDIYLNGSLIDNDVAVTNSLSADGFRIYSLNDTGVELDNISLWNSAVAVPEPSTALFLSAGLVGLAALRRRKRA